LFIVGTTIVSGNWNPLGNTTNATGASKTVTATKTTATPTQTATTAKPTATPTTTATTAKPTPTTVPTLQLYSSSDIGSHLKDIAFGSDNNVIKKPKKDLLEITFSGAYYDDDIVLLNNFISQFNNYSATSKISTNVNLNSPADIWIDFLPDAALKQIELKPTASIYKDYSTGRYYFVYNGERTHVNSELSSTERKRWILRAIMYNLGFFGETTKYPKSVFYAGSNDVNQLSDIDLKALQLMYGKVVTNGMSKGSIPT
jgi:hypothetical protein